MGTFALLQAFELSQLLFGNASNALSAAGSLGGVVAGLLLLEPAQTLLEARGEAPHAHAAGGGGRRRQIGQRGGAMMVERLKIGIPGDGSGRGRVVTGIRGYMAYIGRGVSCIVGRGRIGGRRVVGVGGVGGAVS